MKMFIASGYKLQNFFFVHLEPNFLNLKKFEIETSYHFYIKKMY